MSSNVCPKCNSSEIDSEGHSKVCTNCGHVLEECSIVSEVQFSEGANGQSGVVGQFVRENGSLAGGFGGPGCGPLTCAHSLRCINSRTRFLLACAHRRANATRTSARPTPFVCRLCRTCCAPSGTGAHAHAHAHARHGLTRCVQVWRRKLAGDDASKWEAPHPTVCAGHAPRQRPC